MKFILWLYISANDGASIHSDIYASAKMCSQAGAMLVQSFSEAKRTYDVRFVCTPYTEPAL
jgi:hypothetical protein